jgi:hypothetical protein
MTRRRCGIGWRSGPIAIVVTAGQLSRFSALLICAGLSAFFVLRSRIVGYIRLV